jgi:glycosyltransferase involved in cell wall biosynthesis
VQYLVARNQWTFTARLYQYFLAHRNAYDVIHIHGFGLETFAAIAARSVTGKPVVVKPSTAGRGTKLRVYAGLSRRLPSFWRRLWSGVDRWVSISTQIRQDLLQMGVEPAWIADVPNGVDMSRYHPAAPEVRAVLRADAGLNEADVVICSVSRLSPHKRVDVLVRTFLRLAERHPQYHLWVLGQGEQMEELRRLVAAHPAGVRVRLIGFVGPNRILPLLQAADVFALVSRWEGLSNALLEAMACGLAPMVTDVSGMADVVTPNERGLVVPLDDDDALEDALTGLCADRGLRERFGRAARVAIAADYSLDRTVDRLLEVYAGCIGAKEQRLPESQANPEP